MRSSTAPPSRHPLLDVIYVTASANDARFTRICIASIRYFYPNVPIRLLAGGKLEHGLAEELNRFWSVPLSTFPRCDWGWGFVKLEPLFGEHGQRFLVIDSDTVFSGPVLSSFANPDFPFVVDNERHTDESAENIYYNWHKLSTIGFPSCPPEFLFNTGQWLGTSGILKRDDFEDFIDWDQMPPKLKYPDAFKNGDQGILNYIVNQKCQSNHLLVKRLPLMHWPGNGMKGYSVHSIIAGAAPSRIIHWAGFKSPWLNSLPGADVLQFFEKFYYSKIPYGSIRRKFAIFRSPIVYWYKKIKLALSSRWINSRKASYVSS